MMRNLRFLCAQPAITYYAWQVEVLINNFIDMGVNPNMIDIVSKIDHSVPEEWQKLAQGYPARFFFYHDTRATQHYISSIRPNLLKQHWAAHPYLANDTVFYHDCDIAFTKPITDWITDTMIQDNIWYGSDTRWYIAHSYIKSKGMDVLNAMCNIVNIDPAIVEANELNAIGAQYLIKSVTESYWAQVERDAEQLFKDITELNNQKKAKDPSHHELQIWCADMWSVLWNGWKLGHETRCHPAMEFSWATSNEDEYLQKNIFHNAGVTGTEHGQFYKAQYMNSYPYNLNLNISSHTASRRYYDLVQNVGQRSVLLRELVPPLPI